jgi:hypothetical protein
MRSGEKQQNDRRLSSAPDPRCAVLPIANAVASVFRENVNRTAIVRRCLRPRPPLGATRGGNRRINSRCETVDVTFWTPSRRQSTDETRNVHPCRAIFAAENSKADNTKLCAGSSLAALSHAAVIVRSIQNIRHANSDLAEDCRDRLACLCTGDTVPALTGLCARRVQQLTRLFAPFWRTTCAAPLP